MNNLRDNYLAISTDGAISSIEHIWVDPVLDLAVLAIASGNQNTTEKLIVASFVSADSPLSLGQFAIAIGSSQDSLNLIQKSSTISQKNRTFAVTTGDSSINIPYFTIDSVVYPGFSGGPTIDLLGNVIGMTTAIEQ